MNRDYHLPGHDAHAPEELRGVILVDTNILYNLYASVPGEYKTSQPPAGHKSLRRYLDVLRVLSRNGYEVIIPEMVSYEAENVIASGNDVDSYFPRDDESRQKIYRNELKRFLYDAAGGKRYPHIKILPNYEPQDVADFLGAVHNIIDHQEGPSPNTTRQLVRLQRRSRQHYGDKAIAAMLAHDEGVRAFSKHMFVLSDDHAVLENAARYPDVNVLNTMGFLDGLIKSGMWEGLGLDKDTDVREVMQNIGYQSELATGEKDMGYYANTDFQAGEYQKYLQRTLRNGHMQPFADSLQHLVNDLGWNQRDEWQSGQDIPRVSRVEAFRRRYGEDWQARQNAPRGDAGEQGIGGR